MLNSIEEPLDLISAVVEVWAKADLITPVSTGRNVCPASTYTDKILYLRRIVSLSGQNHPATWSVFKQRWCCRAVMLLTPSDWDLEWWAVRVYHGMGLGLQSASWTPKVFSSVMLVPCRVLMGPGDCTVDHLNIRIGPM